MSSYLVESDNFAAGPKGTVLSDEQLGGCNIEALIESGALSATDADPSPVPPVVPPAEVPPVTEAEPADDGQKEQA